MQSRSTPGFLERFWTKVRVVESGCWEWISTQLPAKPGATSGYGMFASGRSRPNGQPFGLYAHRTSWELHHAQEIPRGKLICHHCDNPCCVRPDHLFLGTHHDNRMDAVRKGRTKHVGQRPNVDLTGTRIGSRMIVRLIGHDSKAYLWEAVCDCGKSAVLKRHALDTLCECTPNRHHRMVTVGGVARNMAEWAAHLGLTRQAVDLRIRNGWSVERACSTPRASSMTPRRWRQCRRLREKMARAA